jgi:hypothetical protein
MNKQKNQLLTAPALYNKALPIVLLFNIVTMSNTHAGWWRVEAANNIEASFGNVSLSDAQNQAGQTFPVTANANTNGQGFRTLCDQGTTISGGTLLQVYSTGEYLQPVDMNDGTKTFVHVNEYLSAALQYGHNTNLYWLPILNKRIGQTYEVCNGRYVHGGNTPFTISMRIKKAFVGFTSFKTPLAVIYSGDQAGSAKRNGAAQTVILTGTVTVPQHCKINADDRLDIDFGNISANAFGQAGIGNKPAGVNVQTRTLAIQCTNIDAQALLTLRVQTDQASGEMIQSDNPDIGFKMADQDNRVLLPNNINSYIPFVNQNPANVTIKAWPVSTTNNVPALGPFRARGYLRVDFN